MKKVYIFSILFILIIAIIFVFFINNKSHPISLESARVLAQERVEFLNPPFQWTYVDSVLVYDYKGNPGRYYFLFVKKDSNISISSFQDLSKIITNITECYSGSYCNNNFATIAIRAYKPVIGNMGSNPYGLARHYRGLPFFMADKMEIEKDVLAKYPDKKFGRAIVFLESTVEPVYYSLIDKNQTITLGPLSEDTEVVKPGSQSDFSIITISEFIESNKHIQEEMESANYA